MANDAGLRGLSTGLYLQARTVPKGEAMKCPAVLAAAVICTAAQAQTPVEYPNLIGPAVRSRPAYDGSASQRADVVPILDYEKGRLFARTVQGVLEAGARTDVGSGLKLG